MRASATQLDKQQTGDLAQKPQRQAIQNLETLIKLDEQLQANSEQKVQPSVPANGNKTQKKPNKNKPPTKSPSSKNGQKKPKKSDPGIRNPGKVTQKQQVTRRRSVIRDFWGHLPESEKQRLRNINSENYLPKYKSLINRYFESLAEDK